MGFFFYVLMYNVDMKTQHDIDLVIAYVDNQDLVWRNTYINFCKQNRLNQKIVDLLSARYGGINFIEYQMKLVSKNMPWAKNIYLLLSNIEQKPKDLPKNCKIVLHHEFIPQQFLPTFNSTTIEMFLWNIKDLSEHFIYANDDMLPTNKLEPSDFFDSGKIKIKWRLDNFSFNSSMYAYQCRNNCIALTKRLGIAWDNMKMLRPIHSFTPMIKSHCKDSFYLIQDFIVPHIRAFRTEYQYNQYIYPLYEYYKFGTSDSDIDFLYTELDSDFDLNHQIVCINLEKKSEYVQKFLKEIKLLCE